MKINPARAVERYERLTELGPPPPRSRPWKLKRWLRSYRAIMALDISEQAELLRDVYSEDSIRSSANRQSPMLAMFDRGIKPVEGTTTTRKP